MTSTPRLDEIEAGGDDASAFAAAAMEDAEVLPPTSGMVRVAETAMEEADTDNSKMHVGR